MGATDFSIVCDSGCDLPPSFLKERGVTLVTVPDDGDPASLAPELARTYRELASSGGGQVVSVHSPAPLDGSLAAAQTAREEVAGEASVLLLDTGSLSLGTGMVAERLASYRDRGATVEEATAAAAAFSRTVRLLVIPSSPSWLARHRERRRPAGRLHRATSSLRVRLSGERSLFLVSQGDVTQLARDTELVELTSRLAHAMSSVASGVGELVYAKLEAGDARALRALEKPLDTNEFDSRCLGTVRIAPASERSLGAGTVGVVFAPASAFDAPFRGLLGVGSLADRPAPVAP